VLRARKFETPSTPVLLPDFPGSLADTLRDRYQLERELGRGGMAAVYLAQDLRHKRPVALKLLDPGTGLCARARAFPARDPHGGRLQHPHILPVHDSGEVAGQLWSTMPFVAGESLRERLRREPQLPLGDALRIARQLAESLDYAHRTAPSTAT
jgi:serine/threonine protein kinase